MTTDPTADGAGRAYAGDVSPQEAWRLLQDDPRALLVDVRTDAEWRYVGVPDTAALEGGGARTLLLEWVGYPGGRPNTAFPDALRAAVGEGTDRPVLFLCRSGVRSVAAATAATRLGLTHALNVLEGFEGDVGPDGHRGHAGWRAAGLPWRQA
ncbi:rhodanese-like domain-containing protein [Cellulomonas endophytica]|uniref:rhodanese-like domain-containing protein n=1 Tax=Cellulomonas endophytica TaxID=2494735 RepID=UPI0010137D2C|nr:rhodanese-like domain-containing protein [Cellulomonas endophytica]